MSPLSLVTLGPTPNHTLKDLRSIKGAVAYLAKRAEIALGKPKLQPKQNLLKECTQILVRLVRQDGPLTAESYASHNTVLVPMPAVIAGRFDEILGEVKRLNPAPTEEAIDAGFRVISGQLTLLLAELEVIAPKRPRTLREESNREAFADSEANPRPAEPARDLVLDMPEAARQAIARCTEKLNEGMELIATKNTSAPRSFFPLKDAHLESQLVIQAVLKTGLSASWSADTLAHLNAELVFLKKPILQGSETTAMTRQALADLQLLGRLVESSGPEQQAAAAQEYQFKIGQYVLARFKALLTEQKIKSLQDKFGLVGFLKVLREEFIHFSNNDSVSPDMPFGLTAYRLPLPQPKLHRDASALAVQILDELLAKDAEAMAKAHTGALARVKTILTATVEAVSRKERTNRSQGVATAAASEEDVVGVAALDERTGTATSTSAAGISVSEMSAVKTDESLACLDLSHLVVREELPARIQNTFWCCAAAVAAAKTKADQQRALPSVKESLELVLQPRALQSASWVATYKELGLNYQLPEWAAAEASASQSLVEDILAAPGEDRANDLAVLHVRLFNLGTSGHPAGNPDALANPSDGPLVAVQYCENPASGPWRLCTADNRPYANPAWQYRRLVVSVDDRS